MDVFIQPSDEQLPLTFEEFVNDGDDEEVPAVIKGSVEGMIVAPLTQADW